MIHTKISAVLEAVTPIHIGALKQAGYPKPTLEFIPGSAIRGAFKNALTRTVCKLDQPLVDHSKCPHFSTCEYSQLFGNPNKSAPLIFRFSYPKHFQCDGTLLPAPRTLWQCTRQAKHTFRSFDSPESCCECGEKMKPFVGFQCSRCPFTVPHINKVTLTGCPLDRQSQSAAKGLLHTIEAIAAGTQFALEIIASLGNIEFLTAESLTTFLGRMLPDEGIGRGKTRGLGKVNVKEIQMTHITADCLKQQAEKVDSSSFTVRLISPLIIPTGENESVIIKAETLQSIVREAARSAHAKFFNAGKPKLPEIILETIRGEVEMVGGWNLEQNRRTIIYPALCAGSVLKFHSENSKVLTESLTALQYTAVGNFKTLGYGQILLEKEGSQKSTD